MTTSDPHNNSERPARDVLAILAAALDRAPEQRHDYVRTACGPDAALRAEVMALLASHGSMGSFLQPIDASLPETGGNRLGRYELVSKIGVGAHGDVFKACQVEPAARQVAIKFLRRCSPDTLAQFEAERQVLASLEHERIARFYDAGETPTGQPYIVMEYVHAGVPITEYADAQRLSIARRIELMIKVCDGVQYAHGVGIIHRDLKPSNILVAGDPAGPVVKIIDFGIARLRQPHEPSVTLTNPGHIVGTPAYLAPEQVRGSGRIDVRADIYSLGAVLYELLCGEWAVPPGPDHEHWIDRLCYDAPVRPSQRLAGLPDALREQRLAARCMSLKSITAGPMRDLDWIPMHALEKSPARRYQTALSLGEDLRRYEQGLPLIARPPTTAYRLSMFTRRHRMRLVVTALIAGVIALTIFLVYSSRRAADTLARMKDMDRAVEFSRYRASIQSAAAAILIRDYTAAARTLAAAPRELHGWEFRYLNRFTDPSLRTLGTLRSDGSSSTQTGMEVLRASTTSAHGLVVARGADGRVNIWRNGIADNSWAPQLGSIRAIESAATSVLFDSFLDDDQFAVADSDGLTRVWMAATPGAPPCAEFSITPGTVTAMAFAPTARLLAVGLIDGRVRFQMLPSGMSRDVALHEGAVTGLSFGGRGRLLTSSKDGSVCVVRVLDGSVDYRFILPSSHVTCVSAGSRIGHAFAGTHRGQVFALDFEHNVVLAERRLGAASGSQAAVLDLCTDPDQTRLIVGCENGHVVVLPILSEADDQGRESFAFGASTVLPGHGAPVTSVKLDATGNLLTTGSLDGTIKQWNLNGCLTSGILGGLRYAHVCMSADGNTIAAVNTEGRLDAWTEVRSSVPNQVCQELPLECPDVRAIVLSNDGARLFAACGPQAVKVVDLPHSRVHHSEVAGTPLVSELAELRGSVRAMATSPSGGVVACGLDDGGIALVSQGMRTFERLIEKSGDPVVRLAWSRDSRRLVSGDGKGVVSVYDADSHGRLFTDIIDGGPIEGLALTSDGGFVAVLGANGVVSVRRVSAERAAGTRVFERSDCSALCISPDDRLLLSVRGTIEVWDAAQQALLLVIPLQLGPGDNRELRAMEDEGTLPIAARMLAMDATGTTLLARTDLYFFLLRAAATSDRAHKPP
ncbi:MAG: serine/threonine-protein kinase [Phycisphaerales bacterium]